MVFTLIILGLILFWMVLDLRNRVGKLEQKIEGSETKTEKQPPKKGKSESKSFKKEEPKEPSPTEQPPTPAHTEPSPIRKIIQWIKKDWILKIGALFLLIGFGWLATYAFLNNWIGPKGRIAFGIISGTLILILGWKRIENYLHQGGIFLVLGSTVNLITIFAARGIYGFFTPLSALFVIFLSTSFVALASIKYKSRVLSLISLALAGAAPLFTNPPTPYNYTALFAYLFIVVLGTVWVVTLTKQKGLTLAALIMVSIYSIPHLLSQSEIAANLLPFAYAFAGLFFITNILSFLKLKQDKMKVSLVTAAGNGLFLLSWIVAVVQKEWQSLTISAWMVVFTVGAFLIFKATKKRKPFYVYAGIGIVMLAAATSAELSGPTLTIAYTVEAGIITFLSYQLFHKIHTVKTTGLLLLGPVLLSLKSITSRAWGGGIIHGDFFVLSTLAVTLIALGLYFWREWKKSKKTKASQFYTTLLTTGTIYIYVLLWLSLHASLPSPDIATMISLIIYTVVGLITYFFAIFRKMQALRAYGSMLLIFVVGRLLLIDIWEMQLTGRIITFFLIGILFVSTAFLSQRKNRSIKEN